MALITYDNKVALNENPSIPDINKVNASDRIIRRIPHMQ
jgi:hypothetical protein